MHTPRRVVAAFLGTLAWVIFVVAVTINTNSAALFVALFVLYVIALLAYSTWRGWRTTTVAGVQRRLRQPGDQVQVRIGYQGAFVRAWDPSRPLGPSKGVRGAGYGSYRLNELGQVTLTWHPVGGHVRELTGPPVDLAPGVHQVHARRLLIAMCMLYLAILAIAGFTAGLLTGRPVFGVLAAGIVACVLPIVTTALRTWRSSASSHEN